MSATAIEVKDSVLYGAIWNLSQADPGHMWISLLCFPVLISSVVPTETRLFSSKQGDGKVQCTEEEWKVEL